MARTLSPAREGGVRFPTFQQLDEHEQRMSESRRCRYPWAMAPTINTTKLVATAIATFVSTDKFITLPSIMTATSVTDVFEIFPFVIASNFSELMDAKTAS